MLSFVSVSDFLLTTLLHIMMNIIALSIHYFYSKVTMTFIQWIFLKKLKKTVVLSGHSAYLYFFCSLSLSILWARTHIVRPSLLRCTHKEYSRRFSMNDASLVLYASHLCLFWKETSHSFAVVICFLLYICMRIDISCEWMKKNNKLT